MKVEIEDQRSESDQGSEFGINIFYIRRESPSNNVEAKDLGEDNPGLLTWTLESALGMMGGPAWRGIRDKSNDEIQSLPK